MLQVKEIDDDHACCVACFSTLQLMQLMNRGYDVSDFGDTIVLLICTDDGRNRKFRASTLVGICECTWDTETLRR